MAACMAPWRVQTYIHKESERIWISMTFQLQVSVHVPGLPEDEDPDYECLMLPNALEERPQQLGDLGFTYDMEKQVYYHQEKNMHFLITEFYNFLQDKVFHLQSVAGNLVYLNGIWIWIKETIRSSTLKITDSVAGSILTGSESGF